MVKRCLIESKFNFADIPKRSKPETEEYGSHKGEETDTEEGSGQ